MECLVIAAGCIRFFFHDVKSENVQFLKMIVRHLEGHRLHVIARGGVQGHLCKKYLWEEKPGRIVISLVKRDLIHRGPGRDCCDVTNVVPTPYIRDGLERVSE